MKPVAMSLRVFYAHHAPETPNYEFRAHDGGTLPNHVETLGMGEADYLTAEFVAQCPLPADDGRSCHPVSVPSKQSFDITAYGDPFPKYYAETVYTEWIVSVRHCLIALKERDAKIEALQAELWKSKAGYYNFPVSPKATVTTVEAEPEPQERLSRRLRLDLE